MPSSNTMAGNKTDNRRGKPKKISNAASTGGAGGSFENRVQAARLLCMGLGLSCPGIPEGKRIVELRFQARVHGHHTDDLVCTVADVSGTRSRVLLQMKRGLTPRQTDKAFEEALGNAWLDFSRPGEFVRDLDRLVIVYDSSSAQSMRPAQAVAAIARTSLSAADWLEKVTTSGHGNAAKRGALEAMRAIVHLYAARDVSDEELFEFVRHVEFLPHDLDTESTPEYIGYINALEVAAAACHFQSDARQVWAKLVTCCMGLNAVAGGVSLETLAQVIGADLDFWFRTYRSIASGSGAAATVVHAYAGGSPALGQSLGAAGLGGAGRAPDVPPIQEQIPPARAASVDKLISRQLDHINERIKVGRYQEALKDIASWGQDLGPLDAHQRARWFLMRGVCRWYIHGKDSAEAADDFLKAADLCDDEDKLAAARVRGHLLKGQFEEAVKAGAAAQERFPSSLPVWLATANARMLLGEQLTVESIPAEHADQPDALQIVAWGLHRAGNLSEAVRVALNALDKPAAGFYTRDTALALTLEQASSNPVRMAFRLVGAPEGAALERAVSSLEPRAERLWSLEAPDSVATTATHLGFAYLLLGRPADALAVVQEARSRGVDSSRFIRLELEALGDTGDIPKALARGKELLSQMPAEALVSFSQLAADQKDTAAVDAALEMARSLAEDRERVTEVLTAVRWQVRARTGSLAEVADEIQRAELASSTSIPLLVAAGHVYLQQKLLAEAEAVIDRALKVVAANAEAGEKYGVAQLMFRSKRFSDAASLYESILPAGQHSAVHNDLLCCYIRSQQRAKAKRLIDGWPEGWERDEDARHLAIELGQAACDWNLLDRLVDAQLVSAPNRTMSWLFALISVTRKQDGSLADFIRSIPEELEGPFREQTQIATAELQHGQKEKGLRRLYRMRRRNLSDIESASAHLAAHLLTTDDLPHMEDELQVVAPGTSVTIVDEGGNRVIRTIDPLDCTGLPETEEFRSAGSDEARRLVGATVGSEIVIRDAFGGSRIYTIAGVCSAYRRLLMLSQDAVHSSVTPSSFMVSVKVTQDADGKLDLSEITRQLKVAREHGEAALKAYAESPLTLGGVARLLGRDVVEAVLGWPGNGPALHVGGEHVDQREAALRQLARPDGRYVIDLSALTELARIECLHVLRALPKVFVSTRTQAIVEHKLAEARVDRREGTAFERDGQLGFSEVTDRDRVQKEHLLQSMSRAIRDFCEVVPAYGPDDASAVPSQMDQAISEEEYATILIALERDATIFTLDARLRMLAQMCAVTGVWPQVMLLAARLGGLLSRRDYSVACLKMFLANRRFVSLDGTDLAMMAYQGDAWLRHGLYRFVRHISEDDIEFESAARVSFGFLRYIASNGHCQFGVVLEILEHLVEALLRHRGAPKDFGTYALEHVRDEVLGEYGQQHSAFVAAAIERAAHAARRGRTDRFVKAHVLMCSDPPRLMNGLGEDDAEQQDVDLDIKGTPSPAHAGDAASSTSSTEVEEF